MRVALACVLVAAVGCAVADSPGQASTGSNDGGTGVMDGGTGVSDGGGAPNADAGIAGAGNPATDAGTAPGAGPGRTARVTARFPGGGAGRITSSPAGIDCPTACTMTVPDGTAVTLTAQPDGNSDFLGWGGACGGSACTFNARGDATAWAHFEAKPAGGSDGGTDGGLANDCDGLVPPAPSSPSSFRLVNQDLVGGSCGEGETDGSGHIALPYRSHSTAYTFVDPASNAAVGSYGSLGLHLFGEADGFMGADCQGGTCFSRYIVLGPTGTERYASSVACCATAAQANDPTGGMVRALASDAPPATVKLESIDPAGTVRWTKAL